MFHCRQSATASSGFLAFGGIATFFSDHQHSFSDCWTFFSDGRTFFGCVWCRVSTDVVGGQSPNSMTSPPVLRPFFGRLEYFVKFWKNSTFDLFQVVNVVFSCLWKYIILVHTYIYTFTENNFHAIKSLHKISSVIPKHCVNSIERVFRINLQITHRVKGFACNWNGRRNSPSKESSQLQVLAIYANGGQGGRIQRGELILD